MNSSACGRSGMARDERLLPRRQLVIGVDQSGLRLLLEPGDLVGDLRSLALGLQGFELGNLVLEFEDGFLEIEIGTQGGSWRSRG